MALKSKIKHKNIIDFKELLKIGKDLEKNNDKSYENLVKKFKKMILQLLFTPADQLEIQREWKLLIKI